MILASALDAIGNIPLIAPDRVHTGSGCLLAKAPAFAHMWTR